MASAQPPGSPPTDPPAPGGGVLRGEEIYRVTTLELFFDLVFVFAITQLTNVLVDELSLVGVARVVLMFGVLWWMYGGYAWLTNMMAPTVHLRRLLMLAGMAGFFMVALATPTAFHDGGVVWGLGYLVLVAVHGALYAQQNRNILRVVPGNVLAAVLIIIAGVIDVGPAAYVLWTLALIIPIALPYVVPPGGRFLIQPTHIVERHGLLVIVTFGESIIAIGIGVEGQRVDHDLIAAALLGLALVATLWWSYFVGDDERAEESLAAVDDATCAQMTMFGYFYAHIPIIVGVIVMAAGLKKAIGHAWEDLSGGAALALAGGVTIYLLGDTFFRRVMRIGPARVRLAAMVAAPAAIPLGIWIAAAAELIALIAIMAGMLALEDRASRRRAAHDVGRPAG